MGACGDEHGILFLNKFILNLKFYWQLTDFNG
jgi:hypothetical protein